MHVHRHEAFEAPSRDDSPRNLGFPYTSEKSNDFKSRNFCRNARRCIFVEKIFCPYISKRLGATQ